MKNANSFSLLFYPADALAAAERAAQWDLPRRIVRPLFRDAGSQVKPELAAFDSAVDLAPIPEVEMREDPPGTTGEEPDALDADFEDADDP